MKVVFFTKEGCQLYGDLKSIKIGPDGLFYYAERCLPPPSCQLLSSSEWIMVKREPKTDNEFEKTATIIIPENVP